MFAKTDLKTIVLAASLGGAILLPAGGAQAGLIEAACKGSDRGAANSGLCACIQAVADQVLSPSDQRLGASFFRDPHKSQEVRQSPDANHETFWLRWKGFGEAAAQACR